MKQNISFLALVLACISVPLFAGDSHECPMHSQHQPDDLDTRGARVMGFDQKATTHQFWLNSEGGLIQVTARDQNDSASIAQIRKHLKSIADQFAAGNFEMPRSIHLQLPPGSEKMQQLKSEINYRYEEAKAGAQVRITSDNQEAISAIHLFLKFQIAEHKTGDDLKHH